MKSIVGHIKNFLSNRNREPVIGLKGIYDSWEVAERECIGYDSDAIWNKVINAVNKVKNGEAAFERDGYAFAELHYNYPVIAFLIQSYLEDGKLHVLDFGGSLGSMYYQHTKVLHNIEDLEWNVVEQKHVVDYGKKHLENEELKYFYDIDEVKDCNFIVIGSSLQYLDDYEIYLNKIVRKKTKYIILDRIPVSHKEWISIEVVHEPIYEASYPIRIFEKNKLISYMNRQGYVIEQTWIPETREQFTVNDRMVTFESFLFKLCDE